MAHAVGRRHDGEDETDEDDEVEERAERRLTKA